MSARSEFDMSRPERETPLHYVLAHSAWATAELLSFCEALSAEQLVAIAPGAFGTVFETLHHFIQSDGHYVRRVAPRLWPADLHTDADDAWEASLGGPAAFERVRTVGRPGSRERIDARRVSFVESGDLPQAFALLRRRATKVAELWRRYADGSPDVSARCQDAGFESPAGVQVAQALQHAHAHREQVCTILTALGLEPPDLSGLAWGSRPD